MANRPKLKLKLTAYDKALEALGWAMLVATWSITIASYAKLPATIATHFNFMGMADSFGSKINILLLPSMATVLFVGLTILNLYPNIFNYPTSITEENAFRQYRNATRLIR